MAKLPRVPRPSMPRPHMEVYSSGHAKSWVYNALPGPVTTFYSLVMAGSITGLTYFVANMTGRDGQMWSMIAIGVMTVIGLIVGAFRARKAKREQDEAGGDFESALKGSASGWGDEVSDPGEIARLDDLRNNFQQGIDTFRDYGRDVYSMPWYVIMGEPGSGKSEAIRRSELKFPEALQDKLQGTGGTYSMHWWFTNHAIILDTAGAMLTSPEAAGRFEEFLKLLKSHRPDCPINGMILTIPTDSLLQDPPPVAEQKAKVIANQLAVIQKALDVRFPIYIMVSKSDRLPGFREYFDAEGQASFERQMMGWSNPDPLGTPFDPARIAESLDTIAMRLQSRALALLTDPISPNPGARRMDEVDSLYGFPNVIRSLAPRLRLYLNVLFQTGAWSAKPPFFRGIYFTSALREGGQLDQVLAQALGMPLNQLPPGGIFAREKSVFLRDVFMEKIFLERGLVTRLADVGAHLRKRLMTFYGATASLLLLALVGGLLVKTKLAKQLEDEQVQWAAANSSWDNGTLLAMVKRTTVQLPDNTTRPQWVWAGGDIAKAKTDAGSGSNGKITRLDHLKELKERTSKPLSMRWFFWPVWEWRDFMHRREEGYLTVFEASAIKPLLDAARERILWDTAKGQNTAGGTPKKLAAAYVQLLQVESWLYDQGKAPTPDEWTRWFTAMLEYAVDPAIPGGLREGLTLSTPPAADPELADSVRVLSDLATQIYSSRVALRDRGWMSEFSLDGQTLSPITEAATFIFGDTARTAQSNDQRKADIQQQKAILLEQIQKAEADLSRLQESLPNGPRSEVEKQGMAPLRQFVSQYRNLMGPGAQSGSLIDMQTVEQAAATTREVAGQLHSPPGLSAAVRLAQSFSSGGASSGNQGTEQAADASWQAASRRLADYEAAFQPLASRDTSLTGGILVGNLLQRLSLAADTAQKQGAQSPSPDSGKAEPAAQDSTAQVCGYLKKFRGVKLVDQVFESYANALRQFLSPLLAFPLADGPNSHPTVASFQSACRTLETVEKDMQDLQQATNPLFNTDARQPVDRMFQNLRAVLELKRALNPPPGVASPGLQIALDAISPPTSTMKQTTTPLAPPAGGTAPVGGAVPAPPATSVTETISVGYTGLRVEIAGRAEYDHPPEGKRQTLGYNGFDSVRVVLTASGVNGTKDTIEFSSSKEPWPLLRSIARSGKNHFSIGGLKDGFSLESNPALPAKWPSRSEFGL